VQPRRALLVGTADTKGEELAFVRDVLVRHGLETTVLDVGILGAPRLSVDIQRHRVAAAAGTTIAQLVADGDRGSAVDIMSQGAARLARELRGEIDGVIAAGGSGNASIAAAVFAEIPFGKPKMLISTVASGNTRPYVKGSDVVLVYPIVDVAGLNSISTSVLRTAANGFAAMVIENTEKSTAAAPSLVASMFGVTTKCVDVARDRLERAHYEVLVFHATGEGGRSMERLIESGSTVGVLDVTTTELADALVGGVAPAGPDRLEVAGRNRVPQVVSLGALDIVNFGPQHTVPAKYSGRLFHRHNSATTLMRTSQQECQELGDIIAKKLSGAAGPTALYVPLRGLSELDIEGGPFFDPKADTALFSTLKARLRDVETHWLDCHINDSEFARAMADRLREMVKVEEGRIT
jgi:uncharacterized protein (UPF0261 family)